MTDTPSPNPTGSNATGSNPTDPNATERDSRNTDTPDVAPTEIVRVRRAPRIGALLTVGAIVGAIVGFILVYAIPVSPSTVSVRYDRELMIGPLMIGGLISGATIAAVVALILDRIAAKTRRTVPAEHTESDPADS